MPKSPSILALALGALLAGCAWPEPYLYRVAEFDRSRQDFAKEPADLSRVLVCYNTRNSTRESVHSLARDACGRYGKTAEYVREVPMVCPLLMSSGAHFKCVAGGYPAYDASLTPGRSAAPSWP